MSEKGSDLTGERPPKPKRRAAPWLFGGLTLLLLSVLVSLQLFGLWEIFTPDRAPRDTLLIYALSTLNFVAFFLFSFIFIRSLLKLRRERRASLLGSKIKTRLVVYFIAVSLLPITGMALFSYMFFNRSMEKFFSFFPGDVVRQARLAQDEDSRQQSENLFEVARAAAAAVRGTPERTDGGDVQGAPVGRRPHGRRARHGRRTELRERGRSRRPGRSLQGGVQRGGAARARQRTGLQRERFDGAARSRGRARGRRAQARGRARAARRREPRADSSPRAQTFEDFRSNQRKVRVLGVTTLGLLTLMLLFAATWSAIHLARGIGTPIRALAEAAKEVAAGNLTHHIEAITDDELAVLADAFNDMTAQLAENRARLEANAAELREKNLALEERRHYIETVLQTVSTGVISLDEENRVTTINAVALAMLRLEQAPAPATPLAEVVSAGDLDVLERVLFRARARGRATEQMELARAAARRRTATRTKSTGLRTARRPASSPSR